ncbi:MAG TPA: response regulator transcription factor [Solirubrobacterales bacterium]|nr:response regulator transcription factor [Solirubrobacterales bacterium]
MAVLSEPTAGTATSSEHSCLVVGARSKKIRDRIAVALGDPAREDSPVFLDTLEDLVELEPEDSAIAVLLCDLDRPAGMATLRRARRELQDVPIVAISAPATATGVRRGLDAGAAAIVFEPLIESTLSVTVDAVESGQAVVPRELRASVQRPTLSHRERQVLTYVCDGLTNSQIAERLFLSESTVKSHLSSVFAKFGVRSRREAAALFLEFDQSIPSASEVTI